MTNPLAIVVYEHLLLGSQLVNRMRDLGYRVIAVTDPSTLVAQADKEKPLVVLADLDSKKNDLCAILGQLRANPATQHVPVLAFCQQANTKLADAAHAAGATLVAGEDAILPQLPQLLEQVLQVE